MALPNANAEPSMEEILASIRRIISEDEQGGKKAEPPLELTQPVDAPPPAPEPPPVYAPPPQAKGPELVDDLMVFDEEPAPSPPPPRPVRAEAPAPTPAQEDDPILSDQAYAAAAGAFTRLAGSMQVSAAHGQTIEGLVREMLRPMLKEWLDANLPKLVEAKVDAEVQRIARGGR